MGDYQSLILYLRQRYSGREINNELKENFENDIKEILPYRDIEICYYESELSSSIVSNNFTMDTIDSSRNRSIIVRVYNSNLGNSNTVELSADGIRVGRLNIENYTINAPLEYPVSGLSISNETNVIINDPQERISRLEENNRQNNTFHKEYKSTFFKDKTLSKININDYLL